MIWLLVKIKEIMKPNLYQINFFKLIFKMFIIRNLIQTMNQSYKYLVKALSILLIFVFYVLFTLLAYYVLFVVLSFYHSTYKSILIDIFLILGLLWLGFNILFNHFLTIITEPGFTSILETSELLEIQKKCKKCGQRKPKRAHHCTICNKCVLQMDHHCPWLYNCIGHYNRRYFVNFLTYTTFVLGLILLLNYPLVYTQFHAEYVYSTQLLLATLGGVLFLFSSFHWYLILAGKTTIEMFSQDNFLYTLTYAERIEVIFGTSSLLFALLPSIRWGNEIITNESFGVSTERMISEIRENL